MVFKKKKEEENDMLYNMELSNKKINNTPNYFKSNLNGKSQKNKFKQILQKKRYHQIEIDTPNYNKYT